MAKFLSQEWLDLQRDRAQEFPERPGATARMQYKITGGPDGDVAFYTVIDNGKILENALGEDPQAEITSPVCTVVMAGSIPRSSTWIVALMSKSMLEPSFGPGLSGPLAHAAASVSAATTATSTPTPRRTMRRSAATRAARDTRSASRRCGRPWSVRVHR